MSQRNHTIFFRIDVIYKEISLRLFFTIKIEYWFFPFVNVKYNPLENAGNNHETYGSRRCLPL
jgi:hypothetical protein